MADKQKQQQKSQPVGMTHSLSGDKKTLIIAASLEQPRGKTKNGKATVFSSTVSPQRVPHPTIPGLWLSLKLVQRIPANVDPDYIRMQEAARELKAKMKQYREARKQQKSK